MAITMAGNEVMNNKDKGADMGAKDNIVAEESIMTDQCPTIASTRIGSNQDLI